jgi:hypothetical protein
MALLSIIVADYLTKDSNGNFRKQQVDVAAGQASPSKQNTSHYRSSC